MEKSQSSESLRRKARVIAGQQHWNTLAGFVLLMKDSGCTFIEVGAVSILLASGGRDVQLSTMGMMSSNDRRESLPAPLLGITQQVITPYGTPESTQPMTRARISMAPTILAKPTFVTATVCFSSEPGTIPRDKQDKTDT